MKKEKTKNRGGKKEKKKKPKESIHECTDTAKYKVIDFYIYQQQIVGI
jgi:hypothetical protein